MIKNGPARVRTGGTWKASSVRLRVDGTWRGRYAPAPASSGFGRVSFGTAPFGK